jgi:hypothetical protein
MGEANEENPEAASSGVKKSPGIMAGLQNFLKALSQ